MLGGSTGLRKLDLKLIAQIRPDANGYYVELGANDGIRQSNTFKLQKSFGWSGLLIEPSPRRYFECILNRKFLTPPHVRCAACVSFDFVDEFVAIEEADLMSVSRGLDVDDATARAHADRGNLINNNNSASRFTYGAKARTLTSILLEVDAPRDFDLLSLDVEGNELAVLKGLDFKAFQPRWILVETRKNSEIPQYLESKGYTIHSELSSQRFYSDVLYSFSGV